MFKHNTQATLISLTLSHKFGAMEYTDNATNVIKLHTLVVVTR